MSAVEVQTMAGFLHRQQQEYPMWQQQNGAAEPEQPLQRDIECACWAKLLCAGVKHAGAVSQ